MPGFDHSVLTDVGWDALADALAGGKLGFIHMEAGDGIIAGGDPEMEGMTQLVHKVMDVPITAFSDDGQGQVTLIGTLSSKNNPGPAFSFTELGVRATIDAGPELLYTVSYNTTPDVIPAATDVSVVIETLQIIVKIDRTITPTINVVAGGDVTAMNIGVSTVGPGWYRDKQGQVLYFKRAVSPTNTILLADKGDTISFDVNPSQIIPSGVIWEFGGATPPSGWLFCNGSLVSIAGYPNLFAAIGTTFGGDGVSTFGLPDFRGRVSMGAGAGAGLTFRTLGSMGGAESVALTVGQMPVHAHGASQGAHNHVLHDPTHGHGLSWSDPGHAHSLADPQHTHWIVNCTGQGLTYQQGAGSGVNIYNPLGGIATGAAGCGIGVYGAGTGISAGIYGAGTGIWIDAVSAGPITIANAGSGQAHSNIQPYVVVNKIIKI
jgi:microcystin-dependent protein